MVLMELLAAQVQAESQETMGQLEQQVLLVIMGQVEPQGPRAFLDWKVLRAQQD
jgi:hypothetical protein